MESEKIKVDETEARLSNLLFNKPKDFVKKFEVDRTDSLPSCEKKAVWTDEDDEAYNTGAVLNSASKHSYKDTLKRKYETLLSTPTWAKIKDKSQSEKEDDDDDKILRTVGHLKKRKSLRLLKDFLEIKRFPKFELNESKIISCVQFHPTASVVLTGSTTGKVTLFSVGGDVNNKLHSFKLRGYSLSEAFFSPTGTEAYIASNFKHDYCVYDLMKAEPNMVSLPRTIGKPKIFTVSPNGKYIAVSDGFEEVHLISTASKELLRSLKHNNDVHSVAFSSNSEKLYSFCSQGEVYIWNLSTYRVELKFFDHGCVTASCIEASPCGRMLATGSGEGIVNVYETANLVNATPLPVKVIQNLKTKITKLKFNSSSEILSLSSAFYANALKLVHVPSFHVFGNFPPQTAIEHVNSVAFSPNSGFMALGFNRGNATLYRLKHYMNY